MHILFDNDVPWPLRKRLTGHEVISAYHCGWHQKKNSELLNLAEADGFDLLVTCDASMRFQQQVIGDKGVDGITKEDHLGSVPGVSARRLALSSEGGRAQRSTVVHSRKTSGKRNRTEASKGSKGGKTFGLESVSILFICG